MTCTFDLYLFIYFILFYFIYLFIYLFYFILFYIFFLLGFYGPSRLFIYLFIYLFYFILYIYFFTWVLRPVKIISLILSQVNREMGQKREIPEKNHLTTRKDNFSHMWH